MRQNCSIDDVLSPTTKKNYLTTSFVENRVEFEFFIKSKLLQWLKAVLLGFETEVWQKVCGYETQMARKLRKIIRGKPKRPKQKQTERRGSSFSRYSCKQFFPLNFFKCWVVHQKTWKVENQMSSSCTGLRYRTTLLQPSLRTMQFSLQRLRLW